MSLKGETVITAEDFGSESRGGIIARVLPDLVPKLEEARRFGALLCDVKVQENLKDSAVLGSVQRHHDRFQPWVRHGGL